MYGEDWLGVWMRRIRWEGEEREEGVRRRLLMVCLID